MNTLDIHQVLSYLPHRYPFVLVDRVVDYTKDQSLTAIKNVTINEPFFPGHFPQRPVMPGVLIVEALAQACALLSFLTLELTPSPDRLFFFLGIDKARFKRQVEPGDQLRLEVAIKRKMKMVWFFEGNAYVGQELCCAAELMSTYKTV